MYFIGPFGDNDNGGSWIQVAGAALDVFDIEPLPVDHPFRSLDNTLLTPHMGVVAEEGLRVMYEGAVENIRLFRTGQPVQLLKV